MGIRLGAAAVLPAARMPMAARIHPGLSTPDGVLRPGHDIAFTSADNPAAARAHVVLRGAGDAPHLVGGAIAAVLTAEPTHRRADIQRANGTGVLFRPAHSSMVAAWRAESTSTPCDAAAAKLPMHAPDYACAHCTTDAHARYTTSLPSCATSFPAR